MKATKHHCKVRGSAREENKNEERHEKKIERNCAVTKYCGEWNETKRKEFGMRISEGKENKRNSEVKKYNEEENERDSGVKRHNERKSETKRREHVVEISQRERHERSVEGKKHNRKENEGKLEEVKRINKEKIERNFEVRKYNGEKRGIGKTEYGREIGQGKHCKRDAKETGESRVQAERNLKLKRYSREENETKGKEYGKVRGHGVENDSDFGVKKYNEEKNERNLDSRQEKENKRILEAEKYIGEENERSSARQKYNGKENEMEKIECGIRESAENKNETRLKAKQNNWQETGLEKRERVNDEVVSGKNTGKDAEHLKRVEPKNDAVNRNITEIEETAENEIKGNIEAECVADDEWIFELLGEPTTSVVKTRECKENEKTTAEEIVRLRGELETERKRRKSMEEAFSRDKKQFELNFYSLLVTARKQINRLKEENNVLEERLSSNHSILCPECSAEISIRKNSHKPKNIKVLRGRNTIELNFDNFDDLRKFLITNNFERNADGLPTIFDVESAHLATLKSTESTISELIGLRTDQKALAIDTDQCIKRLRDSQHNNNSNNEYNSNNKCDINCNNSRVESSISARFSLHCKEVKQSESRDSCHRLAAKRQPYSGDSANDNEKIGACRERKLDERRAIDTRNRG
ncbi:unnamed protein product, partial [Anisakis simplex]